MLLNGTIFIGIGGHDPNSKDKDELGHVPSFLLAYSFCNSDSNSISVNSYRKFTMDFYCADNKQLAG